MTYHVEYNSAAAKAIGKLDRQAQDRVLTAIGNLADAPRPSGCMKLSGGANEYRIRIGQYRVIYAIEDDRLLVLVLAAGHRKDIYQKWERER